MATRAAQQRILFIARNDPDAWKLGGRVRKLSESLLVANCQLKQASFNEGVGDLRDFLQLLYAVLDEFLVEHDRALPNNAAFRRSPRACPEARER